jgi:LmbE family N-acetylglucosaminyl deacetylase
MQLKFEKGKKALVIVAHPDDETIWMGGFILRHPGINWTIFSLCRASDRDRAPKFYRVCKMYDAKAIITDLEDEGKLSIKQTVLIIKKLISDNIGSKKFNFIFTHGANGEYGHPRHKGVYQAVADMIARGKLNTEFICYFNYKKVNQKKLIGKLRSDLLWRLTNKEFIRKKNIMTEYYGYAYNGIDTGYCTNPEAFRIEILNARS